MLKLRHVFAWPKFAILQAFFFFPNCSSSKQILCWIWYWHHNFLHVPEVSKIEISCCTPKKEVEVNLWKQNHLIPLETSGTFRIYSQNLNTKTKRRLSRRVFLDTKIENCLWSGGGDKGLQLNFDLSNLP